MSARKKSHPRPPFKILEFERRAEGALLAIARIAVDDLLELSVAVFAKRRGGVLVTPVGGGEHGARPLLHRALLEPLGQALLQELALDLRDDLGRESAQRGQAAGNEAQ
jgi:hypothetical protein